MVLVASLIAGSAPTCTECGGPITSASRGETSAGLVRGIDRLVWTAPAPAREHARRAVAGLPRCHRDLATNRYANPRAHVSARPGVHSLGGGPFAQVSPRNGDVYLAHPGGGWMVLESPYASLSTPRTSYPYLTGVASPPRNGARAWSSRPGKAGFSTRERRVRDNRGAGWWPARTNR